MNAALPKTAVLYAAGRGTRLGGLTKEVPKCLVKLDDSHALLDATLRDLDRVGIKEVVVITGYQADTLAGYLRSCSYSHSVRCLENKKYDVYNNFYSFYLALAAVRGDFLFISGDVLAGSSVLLDLNQDGVSALAVDTSALLDDEAMKVRCVGGYVEDIGKDIPAATADGEYMAIARIAEKDIPALRQSCEELIQRRLFNSYSGDAIQLGIRNYGLRCVAVPVSSPWVDVDTPSDLEKARNIWREVLR